MELERPRPIHYTCYAMTAALRTGRLAKAVGVDVSTHLDSNPRSEKYVSERAGHKGTLDKILFGTSFGEGVGCIASIGTCLMFPSCGTRPSYHIQLTSI